MWAQVMIGKERDQDSKNDHYHWDVIIKFRLTTEADERSFKNKQHNKYHFDRQFL